MRRTKPKPRAIEWVKGASWTGLITQKQDDPFEALDRDWFLVELNSLRDWPQTTRKASHGLLFRPPTVVTNSEPVLARAGAEQPTAVDLSRPTRVLLNGQLRLYVDEWLQTGRTTDGAEDPRERDLTKARYVCWAIKNSASRERLEWEPTRDGLRIKLPGDGPSDPLDRANRLISLFFLCDWRLKLAKCLKCGSYFELRHWNRTYKRGTFCQKCARATSLRSAVAHTAETRKTAKQDLYRLVAKRFSKLMVKTQNWDQAIELRCRIIEFMNSEIQESEQFKLLYPLGVTGKWLSWAKNRRGIESAVKKGTHAKS